MLALLDFSSAFDTIDHSILVHRLHTDFRFNDTALRWFSSYLTDSTQCVSSSNHCSALAPVHSGVPQGLVHCLILLPMYANPLSSLSTHTPSCTIHLLMTYNYRCLPSLTIYLSYFTLCRHALVAANMLKRNNNKTELMLVTSKRTKHLHYFNHYWQCSNSLQTVCE